jgi:hypothetical protein
LETKVDTSTRSGSTKFGPEVGIPAGTICFLGVVKLTRLRGAPVLVRLITNAPKPKKQEDQATTMSLIPVLWQSAEEYLTEAKRSVHEDEDSD